MTHRSASVAVLAVGLLAAGCARVIATAAAPPGPIPAPDTSAAGPTPAPPDTAAFAAPGVPPLHLTVREKAAQLVMPWIAGDYWATDAAAMDSALHLAADDGVGGFIVGVSASPFDVAEKLNALQRAARVPLLIASDLESGLSARVRGGTAFPGNMALGATDRELDAYEVGAFCCAWRGFGCGLKAFSWIG